ncbi:hypothetical protein IFM89_003896 [Coptis chinensis]|uniref:SPARK domain-containing protein n=1 Tax=Coptis chinensis TaxID=261450 RepID=A0A835M267_9MAGN|nr:hypothetical protein IFM89_003896 [Coptis chinensis]
MSEGVSLLYLNRNFLTLLLLLLFSLNIRCSVLEYRHGRVLMGNKDNSFLPSTSPSKDSPPFIPVLSPPPLMPFTNKTFPRLSGLCSLNFSAVESMMQKTAVDCFESFAPYVANVICCPQLEATISILIGQSSKDTGNLSLDQTHANHCLSDIEQILASQGAASNLRQICLIQPSNLTEVSCPVKLTDEFESTVDATKLLATCQRIDPVNECCTEICQSMISEAAKTIASKDNGVSSKDGVRILPEHLPMVNDCKSIVLRWIASKLDPSAAKKVLRGLSNCKLNKACPLKLPDIESVAKNCVDGISNKTACCGAMNSCVSHLQNQSFVTNLQALDCASMFGMRLQKANVTENVYNLCRISLKDFSVQATKLPALPAAASGQSEAGGAFVCSSSRKWEFADPLESYMHCARGTGQQWLRS